MVIRPDTALLPYQLLPSRELGYLIEFLIVCIYATDYMLQPVGQIEIGHLVNQVIAAGLIGNTLGEFYFGLLAFHYHQGLYARGIDHYVTTFLHAVEADSALYLNKFERVSLLIMKSMDHMLSDPLFRS